MNNTQGFNYLEKERELKENLVGQGFSKPPTDRTVRVNVFGEITKAENFEAENIYLNYELNKPSYWKFDYDEDDIADKPDEVLADLNREHSTTHLVSPTIDYEDEDSRLFFNLCFPFDWQFVVDENFVDLRWPTVIIQVNSLDEWDRYRIEGYGFFELPRTAGSHNIEVKTWKPVQSVDDQAHSFFLGGSIKVKNPKDITKTSYRVDYDEETILNRYGISTESAGSVHVKLNIVKQTEEYMLQCRKEFKELRHKEKLEEYRNLSETQMIGMGQTHANLPALMRTDFGLISRFSAV